MKWLFGLAMLVACGCAAYAATANVQGERVFYLSGTATLQGCIFKPEGKGPFPAVIFNQSAVKSLSESGPLNVLPALASFYTAAGYVLFVPGRHREPGHEKSDPASEQIDEKAWRTTQNFHLDNVIAALVWLKAQSYVDEKTVFMTGFGSGAITTLLASERNLDLRGCVAFSPGAIAWETNPFLRETLQQVVAKARTPIFILQPSNDRSTTPVRVLGQILSEKGAPNRAKVFPTTQATAVGESDRFAIQSVDIWGNDVRAFFSDVVKASPR